MWPFSKSQASGQDDVEVRKKKLRRLIYKVGWAYIVTSTFNFPLLFLMRNYCEGHMSNVLQIMILVITPLSFGRGIALIHGATEERLFVLDLAMWLCILVAVYNLVLGIMGLCYFETLKYKKTVHIVTRMFFVHLLVYIIWMFHNVYKITIYKKLLKTSK